MSLKKLLIPQFHYLQFYDYNNYFEDVEMAGRLCIPVKNKDCELFSLYEAKFVIYNGVKDQYHSKVLFQSHGDVLKIFSAAYDFKDVAFRVKKPCYPYKGTQDIKDDLCLIEENFDLDELFEKTRICFY